MLTQYRQPHERPQDENQNLRAKLGLTRPISFPKSVPAMKVQARRLRCVAFFFILLAGRSPADAQPAVAATAAPAHFCVATYNLENYLDQPIGNRHPKTAEAKAQI